MSKRKSRKRSVQGATPGRVVVPHGAKETETFQVQYNASEFHEGVVPSTETSKLVSWIAVEGYSDIESLTELCAKLGVHSLALEDALCAQRPRLAHYKDQCLLSIPVMKDLEQLDFLNIILGEHFVLTLQPRALGVKPPVLERLRQGLGPIRTRSADYLAFAILDSAVDLAFPWVDNLLQELYSKQEASRSAEFDTLETRKVLRACDLRKRMMRQLKDAIYDLLKHSEHVKPEHKVFFRDCQAHVVDLGADLEQGKELCEHLLADHQSFLHQRTADAMQTLTVVSTIFIPLSFIAGLYGMNFDPKVSPWNMPELSWPYGYPIILSLMAAVAITMLRYFRRKGLV